jgi:hypothetical protein
MIKDKAKKDTFIQTEAHQNIPGTPVAVYSLNQIYFQFISKRF